ncbi:MAG TPA: response regulator [Steroidobacteraceae bacterium]|nr:response regulator [Steroidobacteraceae bacterium]
MVVEPDVLVRMVISNHLRGCGYQVLEGAIAQDVHAALAGGLQLDCVFVEVQLPGTEDGFTLAKRLRQTYPHVDVILTTGIGSAAERSVELCEQNGIVRKPYQARDIEARIRSLLERRKSLKRP